MPRSAGDNERCKVLCGLPRPLHRLLLIPGVVPGSGGQSAQAFERPASLPAVIRARAPNGAGSTRHP
jgi:hypothetical protein